MAQGIMIATVIKLKYNLVLATSYWESAKTAMATAATAVIDFLSKNDAMTKATPVHLAIVVVVVVAEKCITATETVKEHCFLSATGILLANLAITVGTAVLFG